MIKGIRNSNMLLIAIVVILAVVVGYFGFRSFANEKQYVAVYTVTGDLYFGATRVFSRNVLTDVHIIQQTNNEETPLALQKFTNVFWAPEDAIRLNDEQIVWTTRLRDDSQVVQYINGTLQRQSAPVEQGATQ